MTPGEVLCSAPSRVSPSCAVLLPGDGCPALPALPPEQSAPQQGRDWHEDGKCCFYSRVVQTHLCPWSCERGGKVWSLLGMAALAQLPAGTRSHQQHFPSAGWAWFTQTRVETVPGKRCFVSSLGTPCCCRVAAAHTPGQLFCCRCSFVGKEAARRESTLFKQWWLSQNWRKLSLTRNVVLGTSPLRVFLLAGLKEGSNPKRGEKRRKTSETSVERGWKEVACWPSYASRSCFNRSANKLEAAAGESLMIIISKCIGSVRSD